MKSKIIKKYVDTISGFPVTLHNVKLVFFRGEWAAHIPYSFVDREIIRKLIKIKGRLTGAHIKFIRLHFHMTLQAFAQRLGVSHVAVMKCERKKNKPSGMAWGIEKDIRLFMQSRMSKKAKDFYELFSDLEVPEKNEAQMVVIDTKKLAA